MAVILELVNQMENGQDQHLPVKVFICNSIICGTRQFILAVQCPPLSDPENGAVSITGTGVGDTATYTCNNGYEISGSDTRICRLNGEWSGSPPTCEGKYSTVGTSK